MRNCVNIVVAVFFIAVCISAEETTLTFQEGDGGDYSDTTDAYGNEAYPTYNY